MLTIPRPTISWAAAACFTAVFLVALTTSARAAGGTSKTIPQPSLDRLKKGFPLAPEAQRVDIAMPSFSNPTKVTNPLFPISALHSAVLLGNVDKKLMRVETTLLKNVKTIEWMGQKIQALESQYVAYLDGRIEEVALDWYAQADDGSVWYLGEDVFNYDDGSVGDREGTWIAGEDGPAAMIMPARPKVGDVFRPENIPGNVFEEVKVLSIAQNVDGPRGRVAGAIVTQEVHMDGFTERKLFAPGYGEFWTGSGGSLEAIALAVPTDAVREPMPAELETLADGAAKIFDAARANDWGVAAATQKAMDAAWAAYRSRATVPPLLEAQMVRALAALGGDALAPAVAGRNSPGAAHACKDVALAALDLQLRYRPPVEVDRARFKTWSRQLLLDAAGTEPGAVAGDVSTLEWIRDRIAHSLDAVAIQRINAQLAELRTAADAEDLAAAARVAAQFHKNL